jgi:hypothetical protein
VPLNFERACRAFAGSWREFRSLCRDGPLHHPTTPLERHDRHEGYRTILAMPTILNEERYEAASDLFNVDPERCIAQAKTTLQVFHISSYWMIENSLLIACAENDWKEAEYWRLFAEGVYKEGLHQVCQCPGGIRRAN